MGASPRPIGTANSRQASGELAVEITSGTEERAKAALDVFQEKIIKRGLSLKSFEADEPRQQDVEHLGRAPHRVVGLADALADVCRDGRDDDGLGRGAAGELDAAQLEGVDAVINLSGENVGAGRWTAGPSPEGSRSTWTIIMRQPRRRGR